MNAIDPMLVDHALELAEQFLRDTRPTATPTPAIPYAGPRLWFVVQSVLHGEEKVREALGDLGHDVYIPTMRKEVWVRRARVVKVREFKLFNRYLFAELPSDPCHWDTVMDIEEIDCVLGQGGKPQPVPTNQVLKFRADEEAGRFDDTPETNLGKRREIGLTAKARFRIGSRLRAIAGPFGGFAGQVTNVSGRGTVEAMIAIFGQMTPVEFPLDQIEPE